MKIDDDCMDKAVVSINRKGTTFIKNTTPKANIISPSPK